MFDHGRIRRAELCDAVQIAAIYNRHIDLGGSTFDAVHWKKPFVTAMISKSLPDGWFVAEQNGEIQGWASAKYFSDRAGYARSVETAIYLDPEAVGSGVAGPLQEAVLAHCVEHQIHHAMAKIIADNQRSIRFHQRYGYELVGVQKEIGWIDDAWVDVAILQRLFPTA